MALLIGRRTGLPGALVADYAAGAAATAAGQDIARVDAGEPGDAEDNDQSDDPDPAAGRAAAGGKADRNAAHAAAKAAIAGAATVLDISGFSTSLPAHGDKTRCSRDEFQACACWGNSSSGARVGFAGLRLSPISRA